VPGFFISAAPCAVLPIDERELAAFYKCGRFLQERQGYMTGLMEANGVGRRGRQVDLSASYPWPAIIDAYRHAPAVTDDNVRTER
jgi:hypothetical protein